MLEVEQLAELWKVSIRTIRRYERQPDGLPFIRMGKRHLYRRSSAQAWLERRERQHNPRRRERRKSAGGPT
jgi:hypothetical protein